MTSPDLAIPIRNAIIRNGSIMGLLPTYLDSDNVYTRRPIPSNAPFPMIVISTDLSREDRGGLKDEHLFILRDVTVYGSNETAENYRNVETLAYELVDLFHRRPKSITVTGWKVLQVWASGPKAAPADDDTNIARAVTLKIELQAKFAGATTP